MLELCGPLDDFYGGIPMIERRRSQRLPLKIPVQVYGRTSSNHPFRGVTTTKAVSFHGGLLPLAPAIRIGQRILLVNAFTQEERECRVVEIFQETEGESKMAVEFADEPGDFWHVYTAPVDLKA